MFHASLTSPRHKSSQKTKAFFRFSVITGEGAKKLLALYPITIKGSQDMKHKTLALAAAILALTGLNANEANAHDGRDECRNYSRTYSMNGRWERGNATACHTGRGKWEIINLSGPVEYRSSLIEVVKRDVFNIGGLSVTLSSSSYQPVTRYYSVPTRSKVRYVEPVYYPKHKNKHKAKQTPKGWYKYDRQNHQGHDHDDHKRRRH